MTLVTVDGTSTPRRDGTPPGEFNIIYNKCKKRRL